MGRTHWPDWFRQEWPQMPDRDDAGHNLGPGLIGRSFVQCKPCPATIDGRGHHVAFCRVNGCRAAEITPAGCTGAYGPTRAEWYAQAARDRGPGGHLRSDGMPRRASPLQ